MLKYNEQAAQLAAALEDENNFDDYVDLIDEDLRELRETLTDSDGFYYPLPTEVVENSPNSSWTMRATSSSRQR